MNGRTLYTWVVKLLNVERQTTDSHTVKAYWTPQQGETRGAIGNTCKAMAEAKTRQAHEVLSVTAV